MRVALLSLTDGVAGDPGALRGALTIGGRSLARHQLGLALALECARVIVVSEALTSETAALQHAAESGGARFHVIASAHALLPLVTAEDDLLVMADGVLAMPDLMFDHLGQGHGVLTFPVEPGMAAGFERIDINHAYAGAMNLPGRVVAGLAELPSDWNVHAALLRVAVQGRVPMRALPDVVLADHRWALVRSEIEAQAIEPLWLRLHTASAHVRSPGEWVAAKTVHWAGPALLHAGTRPWVVALGAAVALLLGMGAGWFGWRTPGFIILAVGWVLARIAALLARIERRSLLETGRQPPTGVWFAGLIDLAFVALAAWRSEIPPLSVLPYGMTWFAPLVLLLLLHLLPQVMPQGRWTWWLRDRLLAGLALAVISALLPFDFCIRLASVGLLVWAVVITGRGRAGSANLDLTSHG